MRRSAHYTRERHKGRIYSAIIHLLVVLIALIGLPEFLRPIPPEEPHAITVELLAISEISNVKPQEQTPPAPPTEEKPEEKKPEAAKPEEKPAPKEAPPVKTVEQAPPPPPPAPVEKPKEVKKPEPKKPEPKKEKPKEVKKPKEEDLAAVLKAVQETAKKEEAAKKKESDGKEKSSPGKNFSSNYNPDLPMSLSETDAIRNQIARCWNIPAGAKNAQELAVVLDIEMQPDGSVVKVELARQSQSRYESDSFFRAAADSAIRAVRECSPIKNLPQEKYNTWHYVEMVFDPKEMLF